MVHLPCLRVEHTHREGGEGLSHISVAMKLQATDHGSSTTDAPRIVCSTCIYAEEEEGPLSAVGEKNRRKTANGF